MSSILYATATFTPGADTRKLLDIFVLSKVYAKVQRAQRIVAEHAKTIVAVDTGELRDSIDVVEPRDTYKEIIGEVVATAGHAGFVEFGTGLRGMGTYPGELPKQGVPYTNAWVYDYRKIQWKGMPARPYLRPALDISRQEVLGEFQA